jgi:hypothetical protein
MSRRNILGGATAAPLVAGETGAKAIPEPNIAICRKWHAVEGERTRLMLLWGDIEGRLIKEHDWHRLSADEKRALPAGRQLSEIDARLEVLFEEGGALLKALPSSPALSVEAIIANLRVVERLIFDEDQPVVHGLLLRSIRDLAALCRAR